MKSLILDALSKLNSENDKHWTTEGLPSVDAVRALAADNDISRKDITSAAPNFSRENLDLPMMSDPEKLMETAIGELNTEEKGDLATWLRAQLAEKKISYEDLLSQLRDLQGQVNGFASSIESLEVKLLEVDPPPTNEELIRNHLKHVQEERAKDFAENPIIDRDPMSPLDKSFRRSNRRPQMPMS